MKSGGRIEMSELAFVLKRALQRPWPSFTLEIITQ